MTSKRRWRARGALQALVTKSARVARVAKPPEIVALGAMYTTC